MTAALRTPTFWIGLSFQMHFVGKLDGFGKNLKKKRDLGRGIEFFYEFLTLKVF
jgi:hypothetical protein